MAQLLLCCLLAAVPQVATFQTAVPTTEPIDFNREIRPVLADTCFTCHGPDANQRVNELRLDRRDSAFAEREGRHVIVPGHPAVSLLHERITSADPEERMPPMNSGRSLTAEQIELLTEWIRQGAEWREHWAFIAPVQPRLPETTDQSWGRSAVDAFVLARLEREGLKPAAAADRSTLIRRATLDLTGLPPTVDEVRAFEMDSSPTAWETVVDRLLASPRFGEHMAVSWLDAARYADTSGYQNDGPRDMWRWRDWVIDAFNSNMPFDQFTIEQLAGDLLDNPTLDQRIATGFNRNHRGNAEGGIIPAEYQVEYVVDRVDTTFTVWMGLTMGCARCHDHKYDPIRQKEFYQAFAYFNTIPEDGRAIKVGNSPPFIKAPRRDEQLRLQQYDQEIVAATVLWNSLQSELQQAMDVWESDTNRVLAMDELITDGLIGQFDFGRNAKPVQPDGSSSAAPVLPGYSDDLLNDGVQFDGSNALVAGDMAGFGYFDKLSLTAWVNTERADGTLISKMTPVDQGAGYYLHLQDGRLQVNLINRWLDDAIRVESRSRLPMQQWFHLAVTYDGSRLASGIRAYVDGRPFPLDVTLDRINQTFAVPLEPLRIGGGKSPFYGMLDNVRIYARDLQPEEVELLAVPQSVMSILANAKHERTPEQRRKLARYFIDNVAQPNIRDADRKLTELRRQQRAFDEKLPTVMVMQEMSQPRETHLLVRGQYDQPAERVEAGIPAVFPPLPSATPNNRLALARWIVSPQHPLTARVAVNRFWQRYFGRGLVRTTEDFGAQGASPSHPQLLDWLATEFVRLEWDVKALQKMILTSATYCQSTRTITQSLERDPDNELLARGPRKRLPAETIRDQALFLSGLLTEHIGGPSVKPYQPAGLWQEIATDTEYVQSHGDDLYRRSLYTYWKRTVAPPTLVAFDASTREACTVQRSRTNTPLQALALMNDITFVEAARVFAQRMIAEFEGSDADRIALAFLTATSRRPSATELTILQQRFEQSLKQFRANPTAADDLVHVGEFPVPEQLDPCEIAAFTTVTSLILNLDEMVVRE